MAQDKQEAQSLQNFSFDDNETFFGIKNETDTQEQVIKEIKGQATAGADDDEDENSGGGTGGEATDLKKEKDKKEKEEEDVEFNFGDNPEDDEEEEDDEDDEEEKPKKKPKEEKPKAEKEDEEEDSDENDDKFYTTLVQEMKEKGILQKVELKEGENITEEQFFEFQDDEIEARVQETFEAFAEEMDADGKAFIKHKKNGGSTADFFAIYQGNQLDLDNIDIENDAQRQKVLSHYFRTVEHLEEDDLKDKLAWLKEGGKEKTYATKYLDKMKAEREKVKDAVVKAQEKAFTDKQEQIKEHNQKLMEVLSKTESVGKFTFTKEDQKELGNYVTKATVNVGKGKYVPAFQADIAKIFNGKTEEDQRKMFLIAKLIKSDFDVKDLVKEVNTAVTKKVKSKLKETKSSVKTNSGNSVKQSKSLGDYF